MRLLHVSKSSPPSLQLGVGMMLLLTAKLPFHFHPSTFTTASAFTSRHSVSYSSIPTSTTRSLYSCKQFARTGNANAFLTRGGGIDAYSSGRNFHSSSSSLSMSDSESGGGGDIPSKYYLSVQECLNVFNDPDQNVVFLDGSWHLGKDRDGREEYETGPRIKGAKYYDIDDISSKKGDPLNPKGLPHQRPPKVS